MSDLGETTRFRFWLWLIRLIGVIVPQRLRADWRQEWEAELQHREQLLAQWDHLDWRSKLDLVRRSSSAFWDALWMQTYRWEDEMIQDLRYAVRMLLKQRDFTVMAILTLALGIGANTSIFSVVNALLLRPLPYHEPQRLVMLSARGLDGPGRGAISYPNYIDWRERSQSFETMASIRSHSFNLTGVESATRLRGRMVNWNFFQLLGVRPELGRLFVTEDDVYGAARTAVISNALWKRVFGGDLGIIGKPVLLDSEPFEVIGVLPPDFEYFRQDDVFVPIGLVVGSQSGFFAGLTNRGTSYNLYALARLKPGVTVEQANTEMVQIAAQLEREYPAVNQGRTAQAEPLQDVMSEDVRLSLWVLLAAVGFMLLIACVNVANLLLVRAAARQKEIAVRMALGAGRLRIVRQMLCESTLIALLSGVFALVFGSWMLKVLLALAPANTPQLGRVSLNTTVLLFTFGVAVLTSVLCGLLPAVHASRTNLQPALKEAGRSTTRTARDTTRKVLTVVEVSFALTLLVGAGLLLRSMMRVLSVEPGFNPDHLLTMRMELPEKAYDDARRRLFADECLARVSALPGVRSAALTLSLPIDGSQWNPVFTAADRPLPQPGQFPISGFTAVSPSYFDAMGIRILRGRVFSSNDSEHSPRVAVINETLANRIWPGENPIGKRLKQGAGNDSPWLEVIGVAADVKLEGVELETPMQTYLPFAQLPTSAVFLAVRTVGDPLQAAPTVGQTIHAIDKDLPIFSIQSMDQLLRSSLTTRRLTMVLLGGFAALALVLAAVGIYGVLSYSVKQRTHEVGIRMALGAQARDVLKMIFAQGLKLTLTGVLIGLATAFALTRWMKALLFEVSPTDPLTLLVIAAVLLLVAVCACCIPALRAAHVDPMVALRHE